MYGVVDVVIFGANGEIEVCDIKTDFTGEVDPTGTPYESQLNMYKEVTGAQRAVLLGTALT